MLDMGQARRTAAAKTTQTAASFGTLQSRGRTKLRITTMGVNAAVMCAISLRTNPVITHATAETARPDASAPSRGCDLHIVMTHMTSAYSETTTSATVCA